MNRYTVALTLVFLATLVACQPTPPAENTSAPVFDNITTNQSQTNTSVNDTPRVVTSLNGSVDYEVTATEGDVITLPITATDPDGDDITYMYEAPFNEDGVWQTELGDAGNYVVQVNASDGQSTTRAQVLVKVQQANRAPNLDCPEQFTFTEGELAAINCDVFDPEGDRVIVTYRGWTTSRTKQTDFTDAGNYSVLVRAQDTNNNTVEETVAVRIKDKNRAPTIDDIDDQTVGETGTFSIDPRVSDPDGDDVTVNYTAPLNADGVWETAFGDAGEYDITVIASDGQTTTKETFTLTVEDRNQRPVIRPMENISVDEGDTVTIRPEAYDPDGDDIELSYNGWMDTKQRNVSYDAAYPEGCTEKGCEAAYTVFVEATDGDLTAQESVTIFVDDTNRPPVFNR